MMQSQYTFQKHRLFRLRESRSRCTVSCGKSELNVLNLYQLRLINPAIMRPHLFGLDRGKLLAFVF